MIVLNDIRKKYACFLKHSIKLVHYNIVKKRYKKWF